MSTSVFCSKTISRNCQYRPMCYLVKYGHFNIGNVFPQTNNCLVVCNNSKHNYFSSLSKPQEKVLLFNKDAKALNGFSRTFSIKESLESALVTHSAVFKWLTESSGVQYAKTFVIEFHDSSGLPWWMSIILSTCIVRFLITLPISVYQNYVLAKLENARKEMDNIVNDIKYDLNREVRRNKWSEKRAKQYFNAQVRKEWRQLILRENCHPAKIIILAFFQIPTWVVLSVAFRNLVYKLPDNDAFAELKFVELTVGGVAWFPNLVVPDSFVLPIMLGLVNLTIIEIQIMMNKRQRSRLQKVASNLFRGVSIIMIPIAASVPSCLSLYWVTSSMFGLCQNLTFMSPKFRSIVGIPPTSSTIPNPYAHLAQQIRNKFRS